MHCNRRLIVLTLVFSRSYLHLQVTPPKTLVVKGGTTWARNGRWILPENARLPDNIQGSFTCLKSTTWDKRLYYPSEGRRAKDFSTLKNPKASAGFEPANLGTKGQQRLWVTFSNNLLLFWRGFSTLPNPHVEGPSRVCCPRLFMQHIPWSPSKTEDE